MLSQLDHSHQSPRNRRGLSLVSFIWLLAFVSAGLWLLLGPSAKESQKPIAELSAQPAELASFHQSVDSRYRSIEQIRVGQRVVTPEASSAEGLPTAVDQQTWKKLTLQGKARWEDGTIDDIEVQTLQPSSWLALHQAVVGASVPIPLDLREMGLPQMNATVMAIDPCPVIEEGPGRVVLTTVNHLNRFLFDLAVHGKRGPPQAVEVTGWHKLFSEDRQAWTSVCELHLGEVLRGREGELTVESLAKHPGVQRVYNLTVEEEHQYYVSTADLLAHNANCSSWVNPMIEITRTTPKALLDAARAEFESSGKGAISRANFLKEFAETEDAKMFFNEGELNQIRAGRVPDGWEVHHMKPLFRGGDNSYDNLILLPEQFHRDNFFDLHFYPEGHNPFGKN